MDSSIMICICCTADSSVQRPWRMMSMQALIEGVRQVNGAAVEASPSWTMGVSSMLSMSPAHLAAPAAKALPCFDCMASCSFLISPRSRPITDFMAPIWPMKPVSSPRWRRAASSSSTHCCCLDMRSRRFRPSSSLAFLARACARWDSSLRCSARAPSASATSISVSPTLALPKPLSSARPTSASLSAPTSLPPSPHMRQCACCWPRTVRMTCSFCQGESRAKTRTRCSERSRSCAPGPWSASSRPRPVTTSTLSLASCASPSGSKARAGPPPAGRHSALPPWSCSTSAGPAPTMPTSRATLSAVSGASPVSMTHECLEASSALTTSRESRRVSQRKAMKPAKARSRSLSARGLFASSRAAPASPRRRQASARTRWPSPASRPWVSSYQPGFSARSRPTASGEPFVST
mmetsp:Transcript_9897/g.29223  ORF Transcript_9897/g.29223 Transcript_9897/m.29223 type:complete len:408 (-) Transcript_9897:466-1689(-)